MGYTFHESYRSQTQLGPVSLGWPPVSREHSHSSVEEKATPDKKQVGVSEATLPSMPEPPPPAGSFSLPFRVTSPDTTFLWPQTPHNAMWGWP